MEKGLFWLLHYIISWKTGKNFQKTEIFARLWE